MAEYRTQRLRDPVHGLIVFRCDNPVDMLAWSLLETLEFQRLRRIRQLGVSEFVFPSATHTRFAHCVGVFHTARMLADIIQRELGEDFDRDRANVAVIAALLHDVGHGPFSHTFERVQRQREAKKNHESWTAEMVRNPDGGIFPLLTGFLPDGSFADAVAEIFDAEDPVDIYHAIVSSSFDADRLDYLQRDRMMTGTRAGAIDFDWLIENLRVREISIEAVDEESEFSEAAIRVPSFCLDSKARPAAEQFLLARYTLHEQVYFHKTTRCVERMMANLLKAVADATSNRKFAPRLTGLPKDHPLLRFFSTGGDTLTNYLALDDMVIHGAIEQMTTAEETGIRELANGIRSRRLYKTLDLRAEVGHEEGILRKRARQIDQHFKDELDGTVFKDVDAAISIYTQIGGDDDRAHKRLHVLDGGQPVEISYLSKLIAALSDRQVFTRYYFANDSDRARILSRLREGS